MTVLLALDDKTKLDELARRANISKCAILRQLISRAALMEINQQPTCVDGRRCLCPQIHGHAPPMPPDPDSYLKNH
jgi:hypothetical protein